VPGLKVLRLRLAIGNAGGSIAQRAQRRGPGACRDVGCCSVSAAQLSSSAAKQVARTGRG
jgi:hypothetical protein